MCHYVWERLCWCAGWEHESMRTLELMATEVSLAQRACCVRLEPHVDTHAVVDVPAWQIAYLVGIDERLEADHTVDRLAWYLHLPAVGCHANSPLACSLAQPCTRDPTSCTASLCVSLIRCVREHVRELVCACAHARAGEEMNSPP